MWFCVFFLLGGGRVDEPPPNSWPTLFLVRDSVLRSHWGQFDGNTKRRQREDNRPKKTNKIKTHYSNKCIRTRDFCAHRLIKNPKRIINGLNKIRTYLGSRGNLGDGATGIPSEGGGGEAALSLKRKTGGERV